MKRAKIINERTNERTKQECLFFYYEIDLAKNWKN